MKPVFILFSVRQLTRCIFPITPPLIYMYMCMHLCMCVDLYIYTCIYVFIRMFYAYLDKQRYA